jgi:hypothetical protein
MKITLLRLPGLASKLRRFGRLVRLERPADRPSLAWPPVADVVSATLRALFSSLPGLSRCSFEARPGSLPTTVPGSGWYTLLMIFIPGLPFSCGVPTSSSLQGAHRAPTSKPPIRHQSGAYDAPYGNCICLLRPLRRGNTIHASDNSPFRTGQGTVLPILRFFLA